MTTSLAAFLGLWLAMMTAMMAPSVYPMVRLRRAGQRRCAPPRRTVPVLAVEVGVPGPLPLGLLPLAYLARRPGNVGWMAVVAAAIFLDARARGAKRTALEVIATGRAGGPIGVLMPTVNAGLEVREPAIEFKLQGEKRFVRVAGACEVAFEPILNPVTKQPHYARAVFKTGFLTDWEDYYSNKVCTANVNGLVMDHRGKNAHAYVTDWQGP